MSSPRRGTTGYQRMTLGPQVIMKKNTFQGLVLSMLSLQERQNVNDCVSEALKNQPRLRKCQEFPRASRVRIAACNGPGDEVVEMCEDDALIGVGDRLLYLLQRWQVANVVVVVAHYDSSLSGRLLGGPDLFKLATEAAKLAIEQHLHDFVEVAKTSPRADVSEQRLQQAMPTCVMTSDTVPTWPKYHQATSSGGRKGVKQGRINHFRHQKTMFAEQNQETESDDVVSNNAISRSLSPKRSGSLDWMGVSREEWQKLRKIRPPVQELHYLFMCLVILLESSTEPRDIVKQQEQFVPSNYPWQHCRQVLHQVSTWSHCLRAIRGGTLTPFQVAALRAIFHEPSFTENAFARIAGGAGTKIFTWLQKLLEEFDERDLRIDVVPESTMQAPASLAIVKSLKADKVDRDKQRRKEKVPLELQLLQNGTTKPKAPRIVDHGRLFGDYYA